MLSVDRHVNVLFPRRILNFFLVSPFLIQIFVLPASLQITGGFALLWPLAIANFAYVFAVRQPFSWNLSPGGRYMHANFPDFAFMRRLHCLKFTERNLTLRVRVVCKPYFHVSLSLKYSYQSQLSKKHNSLRHITHNILLSFACRM